MPPVSNRHAIEKMNMFEQTFKNIDAVLWKDNGCDTAIDYAAQSSWVLFLKYLDDFEKDRESAASLQEVKYEPILRSEYSWGVWAMPRKGDGKIDHHAALTGNDLIEFVNGKLFPYLSKFKTTAERFDTIQYKIGQIFSSIENKLENGYGLREVLNYVDELRFQKSSEKHELSHFYESRLNDMGNAGRSGGQYYTPRSLIRSIVQVIDPKIGETVYDPAAGSAGFLVEAFHHMRDSGKKLSVKDVRTLQKDTLYGKEKKPLGFIVGTMNMVLHGIEVPNFVRTNTLSENLTDIQEKDRYDVVLANPPFGGDERKEIQQHFPIKSGETAYLFLQHFFKTLRAGGRAGVVIKNTFLSNGDAASLRKELVNTCNLHTVLDLPAKVFTAGVRTVVLFFEKGKPTKNIWYYQLNLDRNLGKTNPLNENDLAEFVELQKTNGDSDNSWTVNIKDVDQTSFDLSVKNPNKDDEVVLREPEEILDEIAQLDSEASEILETIRGLV